MDINSNDKSLEIALTIEHLIHQYGSYIYHLALKLSADPQKAEDLAQETFIKAWKHIGDIEKKEAVKKWLRTICINEFRMLYRSEKREEISYYESVEELEREGELLVSVTPLPEDENETAEEVAKLRDGCFLAMIRKLTLNQRIAFSLIDMFGLSIEEVSELLEISQKAVKGLLYRARLNLESFFVGHCNFLDINNPCSCQAWIEFMQDRDAMQKMMKQKVQYLDYRQKNYTYQPQVRRKIQYYYQNMPIQRPAPEWFAQVIGIMEDFYK